MPEDAAPARAETNAAPQRHDRIAVIAVFRTGLLAGVAGKEAR
jgi:hypothetical protein